MNEYLPLRDVVFNTLRQAILKGEQAPSLKESNVNFMILPAAEFVYYKRGLFELYGRFTPSLFPFTT